MKTGDKIYAKELTVCIDCTEIVGIYPVVIRHDEDGSMYYEVSTESSGKLMIYKAHDGTISSMYFGNNVETSCLVDLL